MSSPVESSSTSGPGSKSDHTSTHSAFDSAQDASAFESWRSSLAQLTGLGMNEQERQLRQERLDQQKLEGDWSRCEQWKNTLMTSSESEE